MIIYLNTRTDTYLKKPIKLQIKLKTTFATFFQSTHCWFNKTFAQAMNIVYMSNWILRFHYESNYKCDFGLKSRIWFQIKLHSTQFQLPFLIFIGFCHLTRATVGSGGSGRECYHQCACLFSPSRLNPPYPIFFLYLTTKLKIAIPFTLFLHIVLLTLLILAMCYSLVMCEPSRENMILCSLDSVYDGPSLQWVLCR